MTRMRITFRRPRFSLRSLLLFVLLIGSSAALWMHWQPWYLARNFSTGTTDAQFSKDGRRVAAPISNGVNGFRLFDVESGSEIALIPPEKKGWYALSFSPDGQLIAGICSDFRIRIWNAADGTVRAELPGQKSELLAFCISPDGINVAGCTIDRRVELWNSATGELVREFKFGALTNSRQMTPQIQFTPDGKYLFTVVVDGQDMIFRRWNIHGVKTGELKQSVAEWSYSEHLYPNFTADARQIMTVGFRKIIFRNAENLEIERRIKTDVNAYSVMQSSDGSRIICACDNSEVRIWDSITGDLLAVLAIPTLKYEGGVDFACASPDSQNILTYTPRLGVQTWKKQHHDGRYHMLYIPEFWLTLILTLALAHSLYSSRDSAGIPVKITT